MAVGHQQIRGDPHGARERIEALDREDRLASSADRQRIGAVGASSRGWRCRGGDPSGCLGCCASRPIFLLTEVEGETHFLLAA